jgi:hypothetical protein
MKTLITFLAIMAITTPLYAFGSKDKVEPEAPPVEDFFVEAPPVVESEPYQQYGGMTLAILPFMGVTTGDGEALALLFSNNQKLRNTYNVVPLTRNVQQRVRTEQQTNTNGAPQMPINMVMLGLVRNIRGNNVMLVNIVDRSRRQLIAGDFRIYRDPSELQSLIPAMVDYMLLSVQKNRTGLPKLAVTPFDTPQPGVSSAEAEMLALLLSAEIASSGRYAVLPRMDPLLQALDQVDQSTPPALYDAAMGTAEYVLTGSVITLGSKNLFVAQIERIHDGGVDHGAEESYETSSDGIFQVIPRLSQTLTGVASSRAVPTTQQTQVQPQPVNAYTQDNYVPTGGTYQPTEFVPQGTPRQAAPAQAPATQYQQPQQQAPNGNYVAPPNTYTAPANNYQAPNNTYTAPPNTTAPAQQQYFNPTTQRYEPLR